MMKRLLGIFALGFLLTASPAFAAEDEGGAQLEIFERCNNWARHYCVNEWHAEEVDNKLREMKNAGISITLGKIQSTARSTPVPAGPKAEE